MVNLDVVKVPIPDLHLEIRSNAPVAITGSFARPSLDDLIGLREEQRWHSEADRLRDLEIDHELEICRLLNR